MKTKQDIIYALNECINRHGVDVVKSIHDTLKSVNAAMSRNRYSILETEHFTLKRICNTLELSLKNTLKDKIPLSSLHPSHKVVIMCKGGCGCVYTYSKSAGTWYSLADDSELDISKYDYFKALGG